MPFHGIILEGSHGERLELGVSEVLRAERLPPGACGDFRDRVLSAFGPGGRRYLDWEEAFAGIRDDGRTGLGRRPGEKPWTPADTAESLERTAAAYEGPLYPEKG